MRCGSPCCRTRPQPLRSVCRQLHRARSLACSRGLRIAGEHRAGERLAHLDRKVGGRKRLLEVRRAGVEDAVADDSLVGIPRHVERSQGRDPGGEPLGQLAAVHPGHDEIGEEQVDGLMPVGQEAERFLRAAGRELRVPALVCTFWRSSAALNGFVMNPAAALSSAAWRFPSSEAPVTGMIGRLGLRACNSPISSRLEMLPGMLISVNTTATSSDSTTETASTADDAEMTRCPALVRSLGAAE